MKNTHIFYLPFRRVLSVFFLFFIVTACGDNDTSSNDNSQTDSQSGNSAVAQATFSSQSLDAGEELLLSYDLGVQANKQLRAKEGNTGTIHWGDNTTTRVRGSGQVSHVYNSGGEYSVAISIDGGSSTRVGSVSVSSPSVSVSSPSVSVATSLPSSITIDCTVDDTYNFKPANFSKAVSVQIQKFPGPPISQYNINAGATNLTGNNAACDASSAAVAVIFTSTDGTISFGRSGTSWTFQ